MIRAAEMVKQSPQSTKQIAVECGYNDVSNFQRDFKMVHATTPRKFRFRELTALAAAAGK